MCYYVVMGTVALTSYTSLITTVTDDETSEAFLTYYSDKIIKKQ